MSTTLTIRTDESMRAALEKRARAEGKSISEVVREILHDALSERPLGARAGHLAGQLRVGEPKASWPSQLRDRNWRT